MGPPSEENVNPLKSYDRAKRVQSLSRVYVGRGQRNKVIMYGEGPRGVRCPWAPNVLVTPLFMSRTIGKRVRDGSD